MTRWRALWPVCLAISAASGPWPALGPEAAAAASDPGKAERQQVKQALAKFRDRFNVKDHQALVGQLPDGPVPRGPAQQPHP
ncbi:MAG TPA: hypothetical protein EYP53_03015, partial [Candidatus Latescibacteria bacterium]|nr:hypothetical protein [Candidatus Latescibacterota bacterium]